MGDTTQNPPLMPVEKFLDINKREYEMLLRAEKNKKSAALSLVPEKINSPQMLPTSNMDQFRDQLNNPNKHYSHFGAPGVAADTGNKIVRVHKNLIISFSSDSTGCGHIRNIFPLTYMNAVFAKSKTLRTTIIPFFYYQHEMLMQARTLFFPRTMSEEYRIAVRRYKDMQPRYGYRMVYDIDDFVWQGDAVGERIPEYNFGSRNIPKEAIETVVSIMEMMDVVCISTNFLKNYIIEKLKIKKPMIVLPNAVPRYFYGPNRRPPIKERLRIPKFIYTGSPTHYDNDNKLKGDFENSWLEFILKNVTDKKIEFMVMGCAPSPQGLVVPWFFEPIKHLIHPVGWLNSYQYHLPILEYQPDFSIAPLVPNYFNYSKSDIRYIETCAFGAVFMGTTFTNEMPSPYDTASVTFPDNCKVEDIEKKVDELCNPEVFNKIIRQQYDYMDNNGRWMEDEKYINLLTRIF